MIYYSSVSHQDFSLQQREDYFHTFRRDKTVPHVFLHTCNRMEIYRGDGKIPSHILRHLCRVTSGLESALPGESAIQGQVKAAYLEACQEYTLSSSLHRLFQTALHVGKEVRNRTRISEGAVSHSQAVVHILKKQKINLRNTLITLVGTNKITEDILKFLQKEGTGSIFLANRNLEKVQSYADKYGYKAFPLTEKKNFLEFTDVLISATSAPHTIIRNEDIPEDKEMLIFDLAFPCDVDKTLSSRNTIRLFNLECVEKEVSGNLAIRKQEIIKAEQIIEQEIEKFYQHATYSIVPGL